MKLILVNWIQMQLNYIVPGYSHNEISVKNIAVNSLYFKNILIFSLLIRNEKWKSEKNSPNNFACDIVLLSCNNSVYFCVYNVFTIE